MFTAILSTAAKTCKPSKCPSANEWLRKVCCLPDREQSETLFHFKNVNGPGDIKCNKPGTERQTPHDLLDVRCKEVELTEAENGLPR
jgi:hypothetical protein